MWKWLCEADPNTLMDVISKTRPKVTGYGQEFKLPDDLLDDIFHLPLRGTLSHWINNLFMAQICGQ
jgi:hypothetical protein